MVLSSARGDHRASGLADVVWFDALVQIQVAPSDAPVMPPAESPSALAARVERSGGIDALRVIAASMVLLYHAHGLGLASVPLIGTAGREGVILFFVISAYVLYRPIVDGGPDLGRYALRRFTRIYPAYIVALIGSAILLGLPVSPAYLVFGQTVDLASPSVLPASWTLQVEVAFYLLLPFVARLLRPIRWRGPLLLIVSAYLYVMVALITPAAIHTGPWSFAWFAWVFPLGMAAALVKRPTRWLLPIGAVALAIGLALQWSQPLDLPVAIAGVLLVLGIRDVPVPRWLAMAGTRLSYPIYLWHAAIFAVFTNLWIAIALTLVVSGLSWVLIERPFQRLRLPTKAPVLELAAPPIGGAG
jgi:peptidoglycan/LPS O-acetylase OafA/YrhL